MACLEECKPFPFFDTVMNYGKAGTFLHSSLSECKGSLEQISVSKLYRPHPTEMKTHSCFSQQPCWQFEEGYCNLLIYFCSLFSTQARGSSFFLYVAAMSQAVLSYLCLLVCSRLCDLLSYWMRPPWPVMDCMCDAMSFPGLGGRAFSTCFKI